jgi:hypothetical protein
MNTRTLHTPMYCLFVNMSSVQTSVNDCHKECEFRTLLTANIFKNQDVTILSAKPFCQPELRPQQRPGPQTLLLCPPLTFHLLESRHLQLAGKPQSLKLTGPSWCTAPGHHLLTTPVAETSPRASGSGRPLGACSPRL